MSGEKYITGSAVISIIDLLTNTILKENDKDKTLTNNIRNAISTDLLTRNTSPEIIELLELSSFLDPRFKAKYVSDKEATKQIINSDGVKLYQSSNSTQQQPSSTVDSPAVIKRQRTLGSLFKIKDVNSPSASISAEQKVQSDPTMYINEPKLGYRI